MQEFVKAKKKLLSAVALLLVSVIMLISATYAWMVLSVAPEIVGIQSMMGANGALEIALATPVGIAALREDPTYPGINGVENSGEDPYIKNPTWGNLVDLSPNQYGLQDLLLRPMTLNVVENKVQPNPVLAAQYGGDGRITMLGSDSTLGVYQSGLFVPSKNAYGVKVAGETASSSEIEDTYCCAIDLFLRTNAEGANLLLQTEGVQRVYEDMDNALVEDYSAMQGGGSTLTIDNPQLLSALKVTFANTLTGEIYGTATPAGNGELSLAGGDNTLAALTRNEILPLTVWIYLDGEAIENSYVGYSDYTTLIANLQFATDVDLYPANQGFDLDETTGKEFVLPTSYTVTFNNDQSVAYFNEYALATFPCTVKDDTLVLNGYTGNAERVIIPATATSEGKKYNVAINIASVGDQSVFTSTKYFYFVSTDGKTVTTRRQDLSRLFCDCKNLITMDATGLDTSNVTDMRWMFEGCSNLTDLDVSGFDTSNVMNMHSMFCSCSSLTALDVSEWDTAKVTDMSLMFCNCSSLTGLNVGKWNTINVASMLWMFHGCSALTELDVSKWNTGNVTDMTDMFADCSGLTQLDVGEWNTANVTSMYSMFSDCSSLTELDVSNWNTSNVTDMYWMFAHCSSLTALDVSNWDTSKVTSMLTMFGGCSKLAELDVSKWNISSLTSMGSMFSGCSALTKLDVSDWNTGNVTRTGNMFDGCTGLIELDVSGWNTTNVADMGYMFRNCSSLTALDISDWNTVNVTDMYKMLYNCSKLTTLTTPKVLPTEASVTAGLPATFKDADGNTYKKLNSSTPPQTVLTKVS